MFFASITEWFDTYKPSGTGYQPAFWALWAVWVILVFAAVLRVFKFRRGLEHETKIWGDGSTADQRATAVIVPIKGISPSHTSEFFQSLLEQDYASYRLIVTVESDDDPAALWVREQFGLTNSQPSWAPDGAKNGLTSVQLVVAGKAKGQGQKVHNQLAAFAELTKEDEIIAFVDADILCPSDWLRRLTAPINVGSHDPATTYRWLVPQRGNLANLFASVINASVATQGGNERDNMPWGGSMAISRQTFDDLDVPSLFSGSLNDDLRLGKAAKRAGYKVGYIRGLVRPTDVNFSWGSFIEFARRQYLQAKIYSPIIYTSINFVFLIYFMALISAVVGAVFMGYLWAYLPIILVTILDQTRAVLRESIYRKLYEDNPDTYHRVYKTTFVEHFLTPFYMLVHWLIMVSTWFMDKVEWGGVRYQVEGVNKVRILGRKSSSEMQGTETASAGSLALPAGGLTALGGLAAAAAIANAEDDDSPVQLESRIEAESPSTDEADAEQEAKPVVDPTEPISPASESSDADEDEEISAAEEDSNETVAEEDTEESAEELIDDAKESDDSESYGDGDSDEHDDSESAADDDSESDEDDGIDSDEEGDSGKKTSLLAMTGLGGAGASAALASADDSDESETSVDEDEVNESEPAEEQERVWEDYQPVIYDTAPHSAVPGTPSAILPSGTLAWLPPKTRFVAQGANHEAYLPSLQQLRKKNAAATPSVRQHIVRYPTNPYSRKR